MEVDVGSSIRQYWDQPWLLPHWRCDPGNHLPSLSLMLGHRMEKTNGHKALSRVSAYGLSAPLQLALSGAGAGSGHFHIPLESVECISSSPAPESLQLSLLAACSYQVLLGAGHCLLAKEATLAPAPVHTRSQPTQLGSHVKASKILPHPERMWQGPALCGLAAWSTGRPPVGSCGIPWAEPPSPSGCAVESRQDHIFLA
nr:uncharacterized protein LOC105714024 isoform X2 [Aotus nancymaae]